ncbi:MAG: hypothetical protein FJ104_05045 [Deltaproteobacteria bacterium]|nr:hypothetical protein [Deltaproteobacteria bacterium]
MNPKAKTILAALAVAALGAVTCPPEAAAKPPAKKAAKAEPGPTALTKSLKITPAGLKFGMTLDEVSKLYERVFDEEFVPLYREVEPGPRMAELDAELAERKAHIARSKLEFSGLPSGLDNTPLGGEYTYENGESMARVKVRSGVERHFFFFGDRLWKIYDVHKLGKKSKLGKDYEGVLATLQKQLGAAPRVKPADPAAGIRMDQADWQDQETILRAQDWGGGKAAVAYIDRKVEEKIGTHRTHKGPGGEQLDSEVADVTRGPAAQEPKGKAEGKKR